MATCLLLHLQLPNPGQGLQMCSMVVGRSAQHRDYSASMIKEEDSAVESRALCLATE